jgi:hypothetical protein
VPAADGQIASERPPEPPVVAEQLGDAGGVDRFAVLLGQRMLMEERERVANVLVVQLGDLELR